MVTMKEWFRQNWKALAFLAFLVFVAYINSLNNAFVADDIPAILNKADITEISYVFATPLVLARTFLNFIIANIFGRSPPAFRAVNILFHLGNVWLLYFLLHILANRKTALFAAAILATHPLMTESVTWVAGGLYAQYSFFLLLALALYVLNDVNENKKVYWSALGSFAVGLLTSEKAMAFPLILLALEFAYRGLRKNWRRLIPFFALGGIWALIFIGKIGERAANLQTMYYQAPQATESLAQIPIAITSYLKLVFWPKGLTLYHSEMSFSAVEFYLRLAALIIFLGLMAYAYRKSKPTFFWLSFFIIALSPTLVPFGLSWIVAERYVYLGTIGILVVVAMGIQKIGEKLGNPNISYAIMVPVVLALTARTIARNTDWKNQDTLWLAAAKTSPSSPQNHNNLGDLYGRRGDLERSAEEFKKAIELKPGYADAHHNLAIVYQRMGRVDEAIVNYQKAAEINPLLWQPCQNLAAIYFEQEEFELAKEYMEKAVEANPENANLRRSLEIIYQELVQKENSKRDQE